MKFASNFLSGADSLRYLNLGGNDFYHAALMRDMFKDVGSAYDDAACRLYVNDSFRLDRLENAGAPYYNWGNGRFFTQVYEKTIQQDQKFKDGEATVSMTRIVYLYDEERDPQTYYAEEWITDRYGLNKKMTKLARVSGKFRRKTIDRKDYLFNLFKTALTQ